MASERDIFMAALEIEDPAERARYLDGACGGDDALRQRVEGLLKVHEQAGSFLERPAAGLPEAAPPPGGAPLGTAVGPYRLLEKIGEGGMGVVYMAEQTEPVRRKVALKVIRPGMDSRQVAARFEAERQALALMDHPNIARVLDAGATPGGQPFFVMELVRGVPLTKFCDERRLPVRQRLALFAGVCRAVQHAHAKGVIHRDLKPSNVLVALYDGVPVPKVIDFGVAKAVDQRLTERTLFTGFGSLVGTPEYMSPEQAELNQLDIDTRSDVYSLGVVLYELLTGTTPLTRARVRGTPLLEVLRLVREGETPRPSARLSTAEGAATAAAARGLEPRRLAGAVRGELDWIAMKALEKDRSRRYQTANDLAADVERHLAGEPVQAGPPSGWYRLRKLAGRHRAALAAAGVVLAALVLAVGVLVAANVQITDALAEKGQALVDLGAEQEKTAAALGNEVRLRKRLQQALGWHAVALADRAWWVNDIDKVEEALDSCPAELRRFEWHYLNRRCHAEELSLRGHGRPARFVAYSADGQSLVTVGDDKTIRTWDAATGGQKVSTPFDSYGSPYACAASPDGTRVALIIGTVDRENQDARRLHVKIWDAARGTEVLSFEAEQGDAADLDFSPDGRHLAVSYTGEVKVHDAATGQVVRRLQEDPAQGKRPSAIDTVRYSPDGRYLAAGSRTPAGWVGIWEATGKLLGVYKGVFDSQGGLAFPARSSHLAVRCSDGLRVLSWGNSVRAGQMFARSDEEAVRKVGLGNVAFDPSGQWLASGVEDGTVWVWGWRSGRPYRVLRGHRGRVTWVAFNPDGRRLASASEDGTVKVWDVRAAQERRQVNFAGFTRLPVAAGCVSPDGRRFAGWLRADPGHAGGVILCPGEGAPHRTLVKAATHCERLEFTPDGARLVTVAFPVGGKPTLYAWDAATGEELASATTVAGSWAVSTDGGTLAHATGRGTVDVIDLTGGRVVRSLPCPEGTQILALSRGGRLAVCTPQGWASGTVEVWDAGTQTPVSVLPAGRRGPQHAAFDPEGRRLAVSYSDGTVVVWDAAGGTEQASWRGDKVRVQGLKFGPAGDRLFSFGHDGYVKVWDPGSGRELLKLALGLPVFAAANHHLQVSPDGHRLQLNMGALNMVWDGTPDPSAPD